MSQAKNAITRNQVMQQVLETQLNNYYQNIATSVFKWEGWPDQIMRIPRRQPEKLLYESGAFTLFRYDETGQFFVLPVASMNIQKNAYGEPSEWRAMALGSLAAPIGKLRLTPDNAVLFRNDDTYSPSKPYVAELIRQLVNVEYTLRLNINAQKIPFIFKSSQRKVLSDKNIASAVLECEPVLFLDEISADDLQPLDFGIECKMAELNDAYQVYDQRICEFLGVDCVSRDKRERLTVEEAESNDEKINAIKTVKLEQRRDGVRLAKELWPDEMSMLTVEIADHVMQTDGGERDAASDAGTL